MKRTNFIIIISLFFLSSCIPTVTNYYQQVDDNSRGFHFKENDKIGIFDAFFTDTSIINIANNRIENNFRKDSTISVVSSGVMTNMLIENKVFGQPIIWTDEYIDLLSGILNVDYIARTVITEWSEENIEKEIGNFISILFQLYDLEKKEKVYETTVSSYQNVMDSWIVRNESLVSELYDIIDEMFEEDINNRLPSLKILEEQKNNYYNDY